MSPTESFTSLAPSQSCASATIQNGVVCSVVNVLAYLFKHAGLVNSVYQDTNQSRPHRAWNCPKRIWGFSATGALFMILRIAIVLLFMLIQSPFTGPSIRTHSAGNSLTEQSACRRQRQNIIAKAVSIEQSICISYSGTTRVKATQASKTIHMSRR